MRSRSVLIDARRLPTTDCTARLMVMRSRLVTTKRSIRKLLSLRRGHRRLASILRAGVQCARYFGIVVDTEIEVRFVRHVGRVGKHHDLVELQSEFEQVFYLLVIDDRRIGRDAGVEKFDLVVALLPRVLQQAGEGIFKAHGDALGEEIADQQDPARRRFQRHGSGRGVLESEAVGDQAVAHFAPDVVAVEAGGETMVVDGIGDPGPTHGFLAPGQARTGEIERQEQHQAIQRRTGVNERPGAG